MKDTYETAALHPAASMYAAEVRQGVLSRREFLTRTTALGVSAAAAYALSRFKFPGRKASLVCLMMTQGVENMVGHQ